jgi:DNA-binding XRE family transcriptional regulator
MEHALTTWRRKAGLTQAELAGRVGVTTWTINQIEKRKRRPSLVLLSKLVAVANGALQVDDFLPQHEVAGEAA